ncbi:Alcohol dehydrogenase zinc-binding domain protein [Fibrella aestuarina BUZ 2]|uniref:Alcohol dehydrogenase zinc-binding domain protein n=1 Tax=Fibrella aestuarina BUZ 2 TaxID=1166018 RepID=I0K620_9BACT|nr:NADP-dependent oxidoreductase [Fibrella aestuarina]CCG99573.1 Alcohol dehydrogenase zinc-binding domain protein [Fibrella aestuarina BUZ 2]
MKAFILNKYDKKAILQLTDVPEPTLRDHDVLVEIHAAGLNLLDSKVKSGEFKQLLPYKLPLILGHDVAGIVTQVGTNVTKVKVGDEVFSRPSDGRIGAFAERIAIDEKDVALKPKSISMDEAASLPLVALTAWQALVEQLQVRKGQKVFIQAGSGGVGTIAIQLATHLGATVATTAGAGSFAMLKNLGADVLIDYKTQSFDTILQGYDAVLNSQDQPTLEKSLTILKRGGKVVSISGPPTADLAKQTGAPWYVKLLLTLISSGIRRKARNLGVDYSFLFMRADGTQLAELGKLVEAGILKPVVDKVFPFAQTNEALAYVESGRAKGKVVVTMK